MNGAWEKIVISCLEIQKSDEDEVQGDSTPLSIRLRTGCGRGIAIATLIVIVASPSAIHAQSARSSTPPNPAVDLVSRPCKSIPDPKRSKSANKNRSKKPGDETGNSTSACIEVHSTAIDVQEYLQAQGREEKWNLSDEHVAEDAWTFSRKLEKDELVRLTKQDASTEHVSLTSGAAFVRVGTVELDDGFVRVQVTARFEGYGQSADRFAPPKESWPLNSNATLENQLISILGRHFKNAS
jgi:hypothetical protein